MSPEMLRDDVDRWLAAERGGLDGGAELAFARVLQAMPRVAAGPAFVDRVAGEAWRARRRRRLVLRAARLVASAAAGAAGLVLGYLAVVRGGTWAVHTGAVLTVQLVSFVVRAAAEGLDWWSIVARVGAAAGETLTTPSVSAALVAIELVGAVALFALSRVLRAEKNNADSWEART